MRLTDLTLTKSESSRTNTVNLDENPSRFFDEDNRLMTSINEGETVLDPKERMYLPQEERNTMFDLSISEDHLEEKAAFDDEGMAPLFMFLSSSLNVELVYVILKSIT